MVLYHELLFHAVGSQRSLRPDITPPWGAKFQQAAPEDRMSKLLRGVFGSYVLPTPSKLAAQIFNQHGQIMIEGAMRMPNAPRWDAQPSRAGSTSSRAGNTPGGKYWSLCASAAYSSSVPSIQETRPRGNASGWPSRVHQQPPLPRKGHPLPGWLCAGGPARPVTVPDREARPLLGFGWRETQVPQPARNCA